MLYACFYVPLLLSYFGIVVFQKYSQLFLIVLVLLTMNLRVKFRSKFRIPVRCCSCLIVLNKLGEMIENNGINS